MVTPANRENSQSGKTVERPEGDGPAAGSPPPSSATLGRRASDKPYVVPLWNNVITMIGLFLVVMAIILLLTFSLFSVVTPTANPYLDIVGYLVLPSILVAGVIITPFGILIKSWRIRRRNPGQRLAFRYPRIDLHDPMQRRAAKFVLALIFIMLPVVGISGYHGYHYTDSTQFCAYACHAPMKPQAVTYARSPHARVSCAECHIGTGASWFVKAKLSGTRQVLAVWRDSYSRPIPPAISHLRPARETCERCHWPEKFYGAQLVRIVDYGSDESNTRSEIDMLLKIGGGDESSGREEGVHKHMALAGQIEYIATDDLLQEIPWVRMTDGDGDGLIYRSDGRPSSDPPPEGQLRELDCMDCHNRPAHNFRSPERAVDIYLDMGKIDTTLPYIKREAVAALVRGYTDHDTAMAQIRRHLAGFYQREYPEVWRTRKASVNNAIDQVREIYSNNFFPDMKVDWRTYPDNIGHKTSPGCFRCHAGDHVNQRGEKISHDCKICHTFLNPITENGRPGIIQEGDFVHPVELVGMHADLKCHVCHTGGVAPVAGCKGCHDKQQGLYGATASVLTEFDVEANSMSGSVDCESCHDLSEPHSLQVVDIQCMDCHEDEEEKYEGMLARWSDDVGKKRARADSALQKLMTWINQHHAEGIDDEATILWTHRSVDTLKFLSEAGPLHNPDAALRIYEALAGGAFDRLAHLKAVQPAAGP